MDTGHNRIPSVLCNTYVESNASPPFSKQLFSSVLPIVKKKRKKTTRRTAGQTLPLEELANMKDFMSSYGFRGIALSRVEVRLVNYYYCLKDRRDRFAKRTVKNKNSLCLIAENRQSVYNERHT